MDFNLLQQEFYRRLSSAKNTKDLEEIRNEYLGRKRGLLTALLKDLPLIAAEERKTAGRLINDLKRLIENELDELREQIEIERHPKQEGNNMIAVFAPKK